MRQTNFDHEKGIDTKPGWYMYSYSAKLDHFDVFVDRYTDMIDWLYATFEKCERHVVWGVTNKDVMFFKFRYEKDYVLFMLRWA